MTDQSFLGTPPPFPASGLLVIFPGQAWNEITAHERWQDASLETLARLAANHLKALDATTELLGRMIHMLDDISAAQDRTEAETTAALAGITAEIEQLKAAVAELGNAPTPEQIAALAARINANADRIQAGVAALAGDDPAPAPAP